jgi:hypothetical protein
LAEAEVASAPEDDAPPPSGVRVRPIVVASLALPARGDVLADVAEQVFLEVWSVVRPLCPLRGAWFQVGLAPLGVLAAEATTLLCAADKPRMLLTRRWPELAPGAAALDRLAYLMVDLLCA